MLQLGSNGLRGTGENGLNLLPNYFQIQIRKKLINLLQPMIAADISSFLSHLSSR